MKITGGCHCEKIRYEAALDPEKVFVCHCVDCQKLTGSPYRVSVSTGREAIRILAGTPKIYVKLAESGRKRHQYFCGDCGSPLYSADAVGAKAYMLRIGVMAERAHLPPQREIWCEAALPWSRDLLPLAKIEKQS